MAKTTNEDRLKDFESMTVLELSEFVKMFEEHFGVTAAAPTQVFVLRETECDGQVIIASVEGDRHDIGKNIVSTLLKGCPE